MRICLYTDTALPKTGGQEMVVDALARHFLKLGHEPVVLAPYPRKLPRPNDDRQPYRVVRHPRFYSSRFLVGWYRWWLLRLHRSWPFDVLHCHGIYPPGYLGALCRMRLGVPTVLTSHGGDLQEKHPRLGKRLVRPRLEASLRGADALVAISRFTRERYLGLCPDHPRVVDLPNGVDLAALSGQAPELGPLDPALQPEEYALFLGRLRRRKGVDVLLEGLAKVPPNGRVQLVIAGDGEERAALESQAQRLGLSGRVRFVGAVFGAAKASLLRNALFTVVPSREWEAFPLVVLESYAAGKPVLATRVHGLDERVEPGRTGWLVPPEAPAELGLGLRAAFAHPTTARWLGEEARRVAQGYDWPVVARKHLELYEELRNQTGGRRAA